jgi:hypothetical protein
MSVGCTKFGVERCTVKKILKIIFFQKGIPRCVRTFQRHLLCPDFLVIFLVTGNIGVGENKKAREGKSN